MIVKEKRKILYIITIIRSTDNYVLCINMLGTISSRLSGAWVSMLPFIGSTETRISALFRATPAAPDLCRVVLSQAKRH